MILSFLDKATEQIWFGKRTKRIPLEIQKKGRRKLRMLNNAQSLLDLKIPPSNRLESLHGDRKGQFSIRINDQWRICFTWLDGNCSEVQIIDYH